MANTLPEGVNNARELSAHYATARRRLLTAPARNVIPIPIQSFDVPVEVPVQVAPVEEPFQPYIVPRDYPQLEDIFEETRKFYNIKKMAFVSNRRHAELVLARQIAMYLCRELTPKSFPEIGRALRGRDHTTILHGCRKIEMLIQDDQRLADEIQLITIRINERVAGRNAALAALKQQQNTEAA